MNSVPFPARVRRYQDHWEVLYLTIYAFNGDFKVCGLRVGAHSADLEHITVRTNLDATRLEWVYYGSHGSCQYTGKTEGESVSPRSSIRRADLSFSSLPLSSLFSRWRLAFGGSGAAAPKRAESSRRLLGISQPVRTQRRQRHDQSHFARATYTTVADADFASVTPSLRLLPAIPLVSLLSAASTRSRARGGAFSDLRTTSAARPCRPTRSGIRPSTRRCSSLRRTRASTRES